MSQDTATLDHELKVETRTTSDEAAKLRMGRASSPAPGSIVTSSEAGFAERLKGFFANMARALEGDHESHKYRG